MLQVTHASSWLERSEASDLFARLLQGIAWEQRSIRMFGRTIPQPRLVAYFAPQAYTYSGLTLPPAEMPCELATIMANASATAGVKFNSVLLNRYRDGSDSVGWHADNEPELGESPTVASLSLGGSRDFAIRPRTGGSAERMPLDNGDFLVMPAGFQRTHLHAIPKARHATSERISLTFRQVAS